MVDVFLPKSILLTYLGFYRELGDSSRILKWQVNDGDGQIFEISEHDLAGDDGCVAETTNGTLKFFPCSDRKVFVCQTGTPGQEKCAFSCAFSC